MYAIDLLKGTGRPPGPRIVPVVLTTLAYVGLVFAALYGATGYRNNRTQIVFQSTRMADLKGQLAKLSEAETFLTNTSRQRQDLQNRLAEIKKSLSYEIQWSPILASIAEIIPEDVTLNNVSLTRQAENVDPEKIKYHYSLVLGLLTPGDPLPIENFMKGLGNLDSLKPQLKEIRVSNQSQQEIQDHEFLYIVIECRFEP